VEVVTCGNPTQNTENFGSLERLLLGFGCSASGARLRVLGFAEQEQEQEAAQSLNYSTDSNARYARVVYKFERQKEKLQRGLTQNKDFASYGSL
jgi:hypothetical protein